MNKGEPVKNKAKKSKKRKLQVIEISTTLTRKQAEELLEVLVSILELSKIESAVILKEEKSDE